MWAFSGAWAGAGAGAEPETFFLYEFGFLSFVAFIPYAEGCVYFKDWHIFLCEQFLGLGLGLGTGAGAEPKISLYRFGFLIFVAFIRYAERHIYFVNWHIS